MSPNAQKLVKLTKELTELCPAFPGTPRAVKFAKIHEEIIKLSESLTAAEQEEVNQTLGILFDT